MLRKVGIFFLLLGAVAITGFAQYGSQRNDSQRNTGDMRDVRDVREQVQSIDRHAAWLGRTDDPYVVLSNDLGVPAGTLRDQREDMNLSFGQLSAVHVIARSSGRDFESVARQFQNGDSWWDITRDSGASMRAVNRQLRTIDSDLRIRAARPYHRH